MNLLDSNRKISPFLTDKKPYTNGVKPSIPYDEVNENAAELEVTKELMSAIKENKPEKANRALMMLIKMCYDNYEEQEERESDERPD